MENIDTQDKVMHWISPINVFLCLLEVCFVVFCSYSFVSLLDDSSVEAKIDLSDNSSFNGLTGVSEVDEGIGSALYDVLVLNLSDINRLNSENVVIRDGKISKYYYDEGSYYTGFIVDLPDVSQSYFVHYYDVNDRDDTNENGDHGYTVTVSCLTKLEMIYGDFACRDRNGGMARNYVLMGLLDYADFEDFYAYIDEGDLSRIKIVSRFYEHSPEQDAKYVEEVKEFVESLGIPVELFEYYIVPVDEIEIL